jgi:hypothetical protein
MFDVDLSERPTSGEQAGSSYKAISAGPVITHYHPIFVFNPLGDLERCALRPGDAHSGAGWRGVLEPVIARYRVR